VSTLYRKLFKTVRTTRRISELVRQRVSDRRTSNRKRPTAVCVESTARYDELVSVCRTQTKPIEKRRRRLRFSQKASDGISVKCFDKEMTWNSERDTDRHRFNGHFDDEPELNQLPLDFCSPLVLTCAFSRVTLKLLIPSLTSR